MDEKKDIEKATAECFIKLYNSQMGTSFSKVEQQDFPDIHCKDDQGNTLNLEIVLTEDRPNNIQALLGRSNDKSSESLKQFNKDVRNGKRNPLERTSCLQGNVMDMIVSRIQEKLNKDYGQNVALVVRDTSPLDWEWDRVLDQIRSKLNLSRNPFDKGIWIISYSKDRIFRVL